MNICANCGGSFASYNPISCQSRRWGFW